MRDAESEERAGAAASVARRWLRRAQYVAFVAAFGIAPLAELARVPDGLWREPAAWAVLGLWTAGGALSPDLMRRGLWARPAVKRVGGFTFA